MVDSIIANNKLMKVWDSLPIYSGGGKSKTPDALTFDETVSGVDYKVEIRPARVDDEWFFPSKHEKSVELSLRKIYLRGFEVEGVVDFDLMELRKELLKAGIDRKDEHILCSLNILCGATIRIYIGGSYISTRIITELFTSSSLGSHVSCKASFTFLEKKPFLDF